MKTVKGPAIFLAQFAGDQQPFNKLETIAKWAAGLGFKGIQIPSWDQRLFNLKLAAESQDYCDQILGMLKGHGLRVDRALDSLAGAAGRGPSCLRSSVRRLCGAGGGGQSESPAGVGRPASAHGSEGQPKFEAHRARDVLGSLGLALYVSLAAAAGGVGGRSLWRTGAPLASHSRCL